MAKDDDAARYRANLQREYDSAGLYRTLADAEPYLPFSAVRQLLIGYLAARLTYAIGLVAGVSLG